MIGFGETLGQKIGAAIAVLLLSFPAFGQGDYQVADTVRRLIQRETQANPMDRNRSPEMFEIFNYEIPIELVTTNMAEYMDPKVRGDLIFERDGRTFVRWICNPDDTTFFTKVEAYLRAKGVDATRHSHFKAFRTASASMYVVSPDGHVFSAKSPTNRTPGLWQDKPLTPRHLLIARTFSDLLYRLKKQTGETPGLAFQYEIGGLAIPEIDQAVTIRDVGPVAQGTAEMVPGFTFTDEAARQLAAQRGERDVNDFAVKNYVEPMGKAMAKLLTRFGMQPLSPHGQNFLVDINTGTVYIRDIQDLRIWGEFFKSVHDDPRLLEEFPLRVDMDANVRIGFTHGTEAPGWMEQTRWVQEFYKNFNIEFSRITGIGLSELQNIGVMIDTRQYSRAIYQGALLKGLGPCHRARLIAPEG